MRKRVVDVVLAHARIIDIYFILRALFQFHFIFVLSSIHKTTCHNFKCSVCWIHLEIVEACDLSLFRAWNGGDWGGETRGSRPHIFMCDHEYSPYEIKLERKLTKRQERRECARTASMPNIWNCLSRQAKLLFDHKWISLHFHFELTFALSILQLLCIYGYVSIELTIASLFSPHLFSIPIAFVHIIHDRVCVSPWHCRSYPNSNLLLLLLHSQHSPSTIFWLISVDERKKIITFMIEFLLFNLFSSFTVIDHYLFTISLLSAGFTFNFNFSLLLINYQFHFSLNTFNISIFLFSSLFLFTGKINFSSSKENFRSTIFDRICFARRPTRRSE